MSYIFFKYYVYTFQNKSGFNGFNRGLIQIRLLYFSTAFQNISYSILKTKRFYKYVYNLFMYSIQGKLTKETTLHKT